MAAELAGEAAIRIVPSLRNFRSRVQNELSRKPFKFDVEVRPKVDTTLAEAQLEKFRAKERADAINLRVNVDTNGVKGAFSQVEHIFKRSSVSKAIRLNIVVLGGDAVYSAVAALGSLATGADVAVKALAAIPGALSSIGVAAGVGAASLSGIKDAFKGLADDQKDAAQNSRALGNAQRDSLKAHRDVERAVKGVATAYRDARRDAEDMRHEVRRGSLDEAGALLAYQEAVDELNSGSAKNLTEFRRQQLGVLEAFDDVQQTRVKNQRGLQDYQQAQQEGIAGSDKVVAALDAVADAQQRTADAADALSKASGSKGDTALAKLAPEAQDFVKKINDAQGAYQTFVRSLQSEAFRGQGDNFVETLNVALKNLAPGLRGVAAQLGGVFKDLGTSLRSGQNQNALQGIIGNTNAGLSTLRRGIDPLVSGLLRISNSSAFPTLSGYLVELLNRFDAFTARVKASGELDKWVQDGVKGVKSLVETGINLVSFIDSVATAWRTAGGEASGVLGTAEKLSDRLANWAKSMSGQNNMATYFRDVRGFVGELVEAFKGIGPLLAAASQFTREWSGAMLTVVSAGAELTTWIQENTGLLKPLLVLYLSFRTIAPIWSALGTAASNYNKVVNTVLGTTDTANTGLKQFKSNVDALRGAQSSAIDPMKGLTDAQSAQAKALSGAFTGTNNLTRAVAAAPGPIGNLSSAVGTATSKVGVSVAAGLRGAVGGLASFLGPQAIFAVAMGAAAVAIDKLGESHRQAAKDADQQRASLDALKSSIDSVSGSATAASVQQNAKSAQSYQIPNFPGGANRNINEDLAKLGIASPQQLQQSLLPTNQGLRDNLLNQTDKITQGKIESSDMWKRGKEYWESHGVNSETLAKAINGDQGARAKVDQVEQGLFDPHNTGNRGDRFYQAAKRADAGIQDLSAATASTGSFESASVGTFIRDRSGAALQAGQATQQANEAGFGKVSVKPDVSAFGPGARASYDGTTYKVETSGKVPPGWDTNFNTETGQAIILPDGRGQVTLTPQAADKFLNKAPAFRSGGLIHGSGSGTSDSNIVRASMGEFIVKKSSVDKYGVDHLNKLNNGQMPTFSDGGTPWFGVGTLPTPGPGQLSNQQPGGVPNRRGIIPNDSAASTVSIPDALIPRGVPGTGPVGIANDLPSWAKPTSLPDTSITTLHPDRVGTTVFNPPNRINTPTTPTGPGVGSFLGQGLVSNPFIAPARPDFQHPLGPGLRGKGAAPVNSDPKIAKILADQGLDHYGRPVGGSATNASGVSSYTPGQNGASHLTGPQGAPTSPGPTYTSAAVASPYAGAQVPGTGTLASPYLGSQPAGTALPPGRFNEGNLQNNTIGLLRNVEAAFPGVKDIGGYRVDPSYPDEHPAGKALDIMLPGGNGDVADGNQIKDFVLSQPNVDYAIYNGQMWYPDGTTKPYTGPNPHTDHVHAHTTGGGYPQGGEQYTSSGAGPLALPPGLIPGGGALPGGLPGGLPNLNGTAPSFLGGQDGKKGNPFSQENIQAFLGDQASNIGKTLATIGTTFVQAFTGIDLSQLTDLSGKIFGAAKDGKDSGTGLQAGSEADNLITGDLSQYANDSGAALGTNMPDAAFSNILNAVQSSKSYGGGVDKWNGTIGQVLSQLVSNGDITADEAPQWVDAVKRQMLLESHGDPNAINLTDSNAAKGTPSQGLMQTIPSTFNGFLPSGFAANINDPAANIAAAVMYARSKGGPSYMTGQHGYATGGAPKAGDIRVSNGEYRMSPEAVAQHGLGFMHSLNQGTLPKFKHGGWAGHDYDQPGNFNPAMAIDTSTTSVAPNTYDKNRLTFGDILKDTGALGPADMEMQAVHLNHWLPGESPWMTRGLGAMNGPAVPKYAAGGWFAPTIPNIPVAPTPPTPAPGVGAAAGFKLGPPNAGAQAPGATAPAPGPATPGAVGQAAGAGLGPLSLIQTAPPPPPPPPANPTGLANSGLPGGVALPPGASNPFAPRQFSDASTAPVDPSSNTPDMRSLLGAAGPAPASNEHNNPALKKGIEGIANQAGAIGAAAAGLAPGGGAAGSLISGAAQLGGQAITGALNILSSAGVGSIMDIGTQATPSGAPLVPERAPMSFGQLPAQTGPAPMAAPAAPAGPAIINNYNGGIHTQNMDDWQRKQQRLMDQQSQPYISKYA